MTYRSRLFLYMGMLVFLLLGVMMLSFKVARDVISAGADEHLRHAALRKEVVIDAQMQELDRYTEVIASDIRLQEYLYITLELATGEEGLGAYYGRQFSSLPVDWRLIMTSDGKVVLGDAFPDLAAKIRSRLQRGKSGNFYFSSPDGVVMVAVRQIIYQNDQLAYAVVARVMNQAWLADQEIRSDDYLLFFEQEGLIIWSSNARYLGMRIDPLDRQLSYRDEHFGLNEVRYAAAGVDVPRLWFGVSENRLFKLLGNYERGVYVFAMFGSLIIVLVGWLMVRNFRKPMAHLMQITGEMIDGKLPVIRRSEAGTEMDLLVNRFADVLDALRSEQSKLEKVHQRLQETAITDSLTGLYNRRYLQEVAPALFAQIIRDGRYLTAILLDMDRFKAINDKHGHLGGDAVLVHFSKLLKHNSRANDLAFRIGGEEFLILNVTTDPSDSVALANKVLELVETSPTNYQGELVPVTISAGISCCNGKSGEVSLNNLMRAADKVLYDAKSKGRNRLVIHSSCQEAVETATAHNEVSFIKSAPENKSEI